LGSLINFCDCLMAGGTSRKNHSEVGSSYIHFNYTPGQDKATASLIGDVARGVMLKEKPIFLGGQGGIVGPLQIGYGTVIPAGTICRKETHNSGSAAGLSLQSLKFVPGLYGDIRSKVYLNIMYIANLLALKEWYVHVRRGFFQKQKLGSGIYEGALVVLSEAVNERIRQMKSLAAQMENSLTILSAGKKKHSSGMAGLAQKEFMLNWPQMEASLVRAGAGNYNLKKKEAFLKIIEKKSSGHTTYLETIKSLTAVQSKIGSDWLDGVVAGITAPCLKKMDTLRRKEK
jgi:bifunctional UDP-N-acetylglucosamine pyrophosphorylase / glucosamine-1-phosphate N-acetyltransferase